MAGQTFNYIYYTFSPDVKSYFSIFLVVGIVGCLSFCFLPKVKEITEQEIETETISSNSDENETLNAMTELPAEKSETNDSVKEREPKAQNSVKKSI